MTKGRHQDESIYTRRRPFTVRFDASLPEGRKAYWLAGALVRTAPLGEIAYGDWDEIRFSPADGWVWPDGQGTFPR